MASRSFAKIEEQPTLDNALQEGYDEAGRIVPQIEPWIEILTEHEREMILGLNAESPWPHKCHVEGQADEHAHFDTLRNSSLDHLNYNSQENPVTPNSGHGSEARNPLHRPTARSQRQSKASGVLQKNSTSEHKNDVRIKQEDKDKAVADAETLHQQEDQKSGLSWTPKTHIQQKYNETNIPCSSPRKGPPNKHSPITREPAYFKVKGANFAPKQYDGLRDRYYYTN